MSAGLESDAYLSMFKKMYFTDAWETAGYSELEIAAAEIDAHLWWTYTEMAIEHHRDGLVSDEAWKEVELEIELFLKAFKPHRAVYETHLEGLSSDFTKMVNNIIERVDSG